MRYVAKSIEVDAVPWKATGKPPKGLVKCPCDGCRATGNAYWQDPKNPTFCAGKGDYVVRLADGAFVACNEKIFELFYERGK
jgi:hypothetical protein